MGHKITYASESHACACAESCYTAVSRPVAVIEDVPMDTLVDSLALHMRMFHIGLVAQVCVGLKDATLHYVEPSARASEALRMWRATARLTRTAWQTVMMWRGNASRMADDLFETTMMQELDEMMKEDATSERADLTDEEADFLEHHIMKQTWESFSARLELRSAMKTVKADLIMLRAQ